MVNYLSFEDLDRWWPEEEADEFLPLPPRPKMPPPKLVIPFKGGGKCWAAEILGHDDRYVFSRRFLDKRRTKDGWEVLCTRVNTTVEVQEPDGDRVFLFMGEDGINDITHVVTGKRDDY